MDWKTCGLLRTPITCGLRLDALTVEVKNFGLPPNVLLRHGWSHKEINMALHKGWDILITEPGKHESMTCPVCNQEMECKRNVKGPTSWASAMMQKEHLHDTFTCKCAGKKWHKQVRKLREEILSTPSAKIAAIYLEEIEEILKKKKATKVVNDLF